MHLAPADGWCPGLGPAKPRGSLGDAHSRGVGRSLWATITVPARATAQAKEWEPQLQQSPEPVLIQKYAKVSK